MIKKDVFVPFKKKIKHLLMTNITLFPKIIFKIEHLVFLGNHKLKNKI